MTAVDESGGIRKGLYTGPEGREVRCQEETRRDWRHGKRERVTDHRRIDKDGGGWSDPRGVPVPGID